MNEFPMTSVDGRMFVRAATLLCLCAATGCTQGLFDDNNAQWRVPDEKLQEIERLNVDAALRAPSETLEDATKKAVEEAVPKVERTEEVAIALSDVRSAVLKNNLDLRTQLISPAI